MERGKGRLIARDNGAPFRKNKAAQISGSLMNFEFCDGKGRRARLSPAQLSASFLR